MDDKHHRNRKVRALRQRGRAGREAHGVWTYWWSWCLDDPDLNGIVPACELAADDKAAARLLVEVGLWDEVEGGYQFHDFHEYNPNRGQVDAKKTADRERVAAKRGASRENVARDNAATNPRVASTRVPNPTQPNPDPPNPQQRPAPDEPLKPHPSRLQPELKRLVAERFERRRQPSQGAGREQWLDACERAQQAADQGHFPSALAACEALAEAAVGAALRPNGKLGFALQQEPFVAAPEPAAPTLADLRPRKLVGATA